MKSFFQLLSLLAAAFLSLLRMADRHPPPLAPQARLSAYAAVADLTESSSECRLDPSFEPVHHAARRQVMGIFRKLAVAAGTDPDSYSIELMRDLRGHRAINAMTCAESRVIWISVTAWERLSSHKPALALLLAHELAHAGHRHPASLKNDRMTAAERKLLNRLTPRQAVEVAADQRAADLMARAGYTISQINKASHYILARDSNGVHNKATATHPAGRDRTNLMTFYLARKMRAQIAR